MKKAPMLRHIRRTLYNFKKLWPTPIQIHNVLDLAKTDYITGVVTRRTTTTTIRKAVELPRQELRKFVYDLSYIASSKNFTYGGLFDQATRVIIIDARDLPKLFEIKIDGTVTIEGERMQINTVSELPHRTGYLVGLIRSVTGARRNDTH